MRNLALIVAILPFIMAATPGPRCTLLEQGLGVEAPLVKEITPLSDEQLLHAAITLKQTRDLEIVSANAITQLRQLAGPGSYDSLLEDAVINQVIVKLRDRVPSLRKIVGERVRDLAAILRGGNRRHPGNIHMGYGYRILPDDDKAFQDPNFLARTLENIGFTAIGDAANDPTDASASFLHTWRRYLPGLEVLAFTQTGSDANSLTFDIADHVARERFGKGGPGELLILSGSYGGGRGKIRHIGGVHRVRIVDKKEFIIESPRTTTREGWSKAEADELARKEKRSLADIDAKMRDPDFRVGGILLEPIYGTSQGGYYRPEYLSQLRRLADKHQVPIIADEILMGGGRTGRFFSYQHYENFLPDYVTFGKGLIVAGVAKVTRDVPQTSPDLSFLTKQANPDDLLRSAQVIVRIFEDGLLENAQEVGAYFLDRLHAFEEERFQEKESHGVGLFIVAGPKTGPQLNFINGDRRIMPYLTLTKKDVDRMFAHAESEFPAY